MRWILKNVADVVRHLGDLLIYDFLTANEDLPAGWLQKTIQVLDQRRLAGAVLADQCDKLTFLDCQIDILECNLAHRLINVPETFDIDDIFTIKIKRHVLQSLLQFVFFSSARSFSIAPSTVMGISSIAAPRLRSCMKSCVTSGG